MGSWWAGILHPPLKPRWMQNTGAGWQVNSMASERMAEVETRGTEQLISGFSVLRSVRRDRDTEDEAVSGAHKAKGALSMVTAEHMPDTIGIRLTSQHAAKLRALAAADDRKVSALARRLLVDALAQLETPKNTEVPMS